MAEVEIPVGYGNAVLVWNTSTKVRPITVTLGYATAGSFVDAVANANGIFGAATSASGSLSIAAPGAMTTAWQFSSVHCYERRVAGPLVRGDSTSTAVVGTVTSGTNEMVVSAPLRATKRTGFVGRQYRGRMYGPYVGLESEVTAVGNILSSPLGLIRAQWNKFYANLIALPINPYLLHSDPLVAPTPITSFFVQPKVGTQRRRLNG